MASPSRIICSVTLQKTAEEELKEDNKEPHFFTPNSPDANPTKHTWNAMK